MKETKGTKDGKGSRGQAILEYRGFKGTRVGRGSKV
jgi:hypothetical protein